MAVDQVEVLDLSTLQRIIEKYKGERGSLIPVLQQAQEVYGYLPREVLQAIAKDTGVPLSQVYGVVTFYAQFYLNRRGKHVIATCDGTSCHVCGGVKLIDTVEKALGIKAGETTPDYQFTFDIVYCLGCCGLSPVAVVDGKVYGRLTSDRVNELLSDVRESDLAASRQ
jgi:NADH-quinone oxidoreductase subunit E